MSKRKELIESIVEGIQEKKGRDIVVADLTEIYDAICKYMVICQGNTPTQIAAIVESVGDKARILCGEKPASVDGLRNAQWVAMDYGDVLVHVFLPENRTFYNLEHLWADAQLREIPNLD